MRQCLLVLVLGVAAFATGGASAGGSGPSAPAHPSEAGVAVGVVNVTGGPEQIDETQLAVGADGTAAVAWSRFLGHTTVIRVALRPAGGHRFAPPQTVSLPAEVSREPQLAVGPDGKVAVVWFAYPGKRIVVREATRRPGKARFDPPVVISRGGIALSPRVAISPDGTTTVAWAWEGSGRSVGIQEVTRPKGSRRFSVPKTLLRGGYQPNPTALVTAGLDGSTTIGWTRNGHLETVTRRRGKRRFDRPVRVAAHVRSFALSQGGEGTTALAWESEDRHVRIGMATRRGHTTFGAKQTLSNTESDAQAGTDSKGRAAHRIRIAEMDPAVVVNRDGLVTVAWLRPTSSGWVLDVAWRARASMRWHTRCAVEDGLDPICAPAIAPSSRGSRIVWCAFTGGIYETTLSDGTFETHRRLSQPAADVSAPRIAATPRGGAIVVWTKVVKLDQIEQLTKLA